MTIEGRSRDDPARRIAALRREAERLAGGLGDLRQRSTVYHHMYDASAGNHVFPLLAAHGALWASGYFRAGIRGGEALARFGCLSAARRAQRTAQLHEFADAFRDINRRVCVETYYVFEVTRSPGLIAAADPKIPADLGDQMAECHAAVRAGRSLSSSRKRALFEAFFLWEQQHIVGPAVSRAFASFDWFPVRAMALRPRVTFAYLSRSWPIRFTDFADTSERIRMGLRAYDAGEEVGWAHVEQSLTAYRVLDSEYLANARVAFERYRCATA